MEGPNKLNKDDAQDTANMMRAKMGMNPHTGKVEKSFHELGNVDQSFKRRGYNIEGRAPKAEEYEAAFQAIEEMKRLAEEEPNAEKILSRVAQIYTKYIDGAALAFSFIGEEDFSERGIKRQEAYLSRFDDAAEKLRKMQKEGQKFEKGNMAA